MISKVWNSAGQYAKGIIAVATAVTAALQPYFGADKWFLAVIAGIGAASTILVPNQPKQ